MTLSVTNGYKTYKDNVILDNQFIEFYDGNIYGLKGDNGSGKTVLLKLLAGYESLDKGQIKQDNKKEIKLHQYIRNAGIVIEQVAFLSHMTLLDNLKLLKTIDKSITDTMIAYWIDYYNLKEHQHKKYRHLSLGTRQKLALIQAFISSPDILLLDEPMNALDKHSVELTKQIINSYKKDKLVIMTSHISQNISDLCNVCYQIENGKLQKCD